MPNRLFDQDDDLDAPDLSELYCPECGNGGVNVRVVSWPEEGSWFRGVGRAVCDYCRISFSIHHDGPIEPKKPKKHWFAKVASRRIGF